MTLNVAAAAVIRDCHGLCIPRWRRPRRHSWLQVMRFIVARYRRVLGDVMDDELIAAAVGSGVTP